MKNSESHMLNLPNHRRVFIEIMDYFRLQSELVGAFIAGSGATGGMDRYSDLDLGFICPSDQDREKIWALRFSWNFTNWFHRMDADHVKPYFIIYLFDPDIHVDLAFYSLEDLPPVAGAPYEILWDSLNGKLTTWASESNRPRSCQVDWSNVVHEDERFWTWIHYSWCHVARGEYYDIASQFEFLRRIPHNWQAQISGQMNFDSRRLEQTGGEEFIKMMRPSYVTPDLKSLKAGLLALIEIHNVQRTKIDQLAEPRWKTTLSTRNLITRLVSEL